MTSIQAAVLREPGRPLRIERLEMEDPRPDEVLVRLVERAHAPQFVCA